MHKRLILILVICLFFGLGALGALFVHGPDSQYPSSHYSNSQYPVSLHKEKAAVRVGGPFSLTDHNGQKITDRDFGERKKLIYFGYTQQGSVLDKAALQVLSEVLQGLGEKKDKLAVIFVTIDPDRDTPERIKRFLEPYHKDITGLTGPVAAIEQVMKSYLVYRKKIVQDDIEGYLLHHSATFYLMDQNNQYLEHFNPTMLPENITKTILKYF